MRDDIGNDSTDGRIERAKDKALGKHDSDPSIGDEVGEAAGGIGGVLAGAAVGSAAGLVGTLIGGIAGALGGWWTGRAISEAAGQLTHEDDEFYRSAYESSPNRYADRGYEDIRPAFHLGHVAAYNPDYANKNWSDVESELQRGWGPEQARRYGEWTSVSGFANQGFMRGRSLANTANRSTGVDERTFDRVSPEINTSEKL